MLTPAPARAKLEDVVLCDRSRHSEAPGAVRAVETEQNRGCQGPGARDRGPGAGARAGELPFSGWSVSCAGGEAGEGRGDGCVAFCAQRRCTAT